MGPMLCVTFLLAWLTQLKIGCSMIPHQFGDVLVRSTAPVEDAVVARGLSITTRDGQSFTCALWPAACQRAEGLVENWADKWRARISRAIFVDDPYGYDKWLSPNTSYG